MYLPICIIKSYIFQIKFLKINKKSDVPELKRTHDYYYQIQGQLHISKKRYCYFVVFSENWIHIEKIVYNDEFWQNEMYTKLTRSIFKILLLKKK